MPFTPSSSRLLRCCVALLLSPVTLPCAAATAPPQPAAATPQALAARIDAIVGEPRYAGAQWGVAVVSLDDDRPLYVHRADQLMQPASTAKLFTAALTLSTLTPDYRIPTRLLSAATIHHGRLDGPLLLYGMGDPTLGTPGANPGWADDLAAQLAARGVRDVHGDIVADTCYFSGPTLGTGWEASDLLGWFAAPASALSVHENNVLLSVTPAARAGEPPQLAFTPAAAAPPLANSLTTTATHTRDDINLFRAPGDPLLHAFGGIAAGAPTRHYRLAIPDPARQAGEELQQALARHGIRQRGELRVLDWPRDDQPLLAQAHVLAEVQSPPVTDILKQGLKRSQNLYLQNLLQIDGINARDATTANPSNAPGGFLSSEAKGLRALQALLDRIGIAPSSVLLEEGTGLSRGDVVTPAAMVKLLQYLAAQPYAAVLRDMLPLAGVDGTLEWRLRDGPATDRMQAKTGSMAYTHSLAGYVTTASGKRLAFVILLNNYDRGADGPPANHDIDAIASLLAAYRG